MSDAKQQLGSSGVGIFKAWGQIAAGRLARAEGQLQNTLAILDAKEARDAGFRNEEKFRKANGRMLASFMTGIAKSGVRFEGSAARALAESSINAEKNVLEARFNFLESARKTEFAGGMAKMRGINAYRAGRMAAVGTMIETGAKAASAGA